MSILLNWSSYVESYFLFFSTNENFIGRVNDNDYSSDE